MSAFRTGEPARTKRERLFFLDWLRVLAVLGVFFFHTLRPFDSLLDWNVKNPGRSFIATVLEAFFVQWGMPLFFVLAGAASWFALGSRPGHRFVRERSLRLLLPLLIGFLLLSPPQAYLEALTHGHFVGTFFQFLPWFVAHLQISWHAPWINYTYHLWFLEFLWLFTLLALPLFLFLRAAAGQPLIERLARWSAKPGGIFLFIVPIALIQMTLRVAFPMLYDWADFLYFFAFFVYGYLLFSRPSFGQALRTHGRIALVIGLTAFFIMLATYFAGYLVAWETSPTYTTGYLLYQLLRSMNTWAWLVFILSCGIRWLNRNSKVLGPANEAVLPFYVFQQPVILLIAFYVVQWPMGILPKWLIISTLALLLILMVYELLIRRVNTMRWLFGLKPRQHPLREGGYGREPYRRQAESPSGKADQPVTLHAWKEAPSEGMPAQSDEQALIG